MELHDLEIRNAIRVERVLRQAGIQGGAVSLGEQQAAGPGHLAAGRNKDAVIESLLQPGNVAGVMEIHDVLRNPVAQGDNIHGPSLPAAGEPS